MDLFKKQIDRVRKDDDVQGIVLRVDSPGGTVTASHYIYHHLKELQRQKEADNGKEFPMVVSMGSIAASGGYYVFHGGWCRGGYNLCGRNDLERVRLGSSFPVNDISGFLEKHNIVDHSYVSGGFEADG